jgi:hypothetical protein
MHTIFIFLNCHFVDLRSMASACYIFLSLMVIETLFIFYISYLTLLFENFDNKKKVDLDHHP